MTLKTDQKKPRRKKLTPKREGFVEDFVKTGNATEAVVRNFDTKNRDSAKVIGSKLLTNANVIEAVEEKKLTLKEALEKKGVTSEKIAEKVDVLLEATDEKGNPDYKAIDKGIAHATRIRGDVNDLPPVAPTHATYNFLFSKEVQADVKEIEARIKARLIAPTPVIHVQQD